MVRIIGVWYRAITRGSPLARVLSKYGVNVEEHRHSTTVKGRRYAHYKLIMRDERVAAVLARLAKDESRLRWLMKRFENVVLDVLAHMDRMRSWKALLDLLPWSRLGRWFRIKPFDCTTYEPWRNRKIVLFLKLSWRVWLYCRLLALEGMSCLSSV